MKLKCDQCNKLFKNLPDFEDHRSSKFCFAADYELVTEEGDEIPTRTPTPPLADECAKLLDNGWSIVMYRNALGSYTAIATKTPLSDVIHQFEERTGLKTSEMTDDFGPAAALYRLTEKVFGNIV
jgi:hypothetical protein